MATKTPDLTQFKLPNPTVVPPATTPSPTVEPTPGLPSTTGTPTSPPLDLSKFKIPPTPKTNPSTGIVGTLADWAYEGGKLVVQSIDEPFLAAAGVPRAYWDLLTGNKEAAKAGVEQGYSYGDFLGTAKPLGSTYDPSKSLVDEANLRTIADTAGTALEGATYFIPGVGEALGAAKVGAEVGGNVASRLAVGAAKYAATGTGKFAIGQGVSSGLESYGQGTSPTGALQTGILSTAMSAGIMKLFSAVGTPMTKALSGVPSAIGSMFSNSLKTRVGQALMKQMDGISKSLSGLSTNEAYKAITDVAGDAAKRFRTEYQAVQSNVNKTFINALAQVRSSTSKFVPEDDVKWVKDLADKSFGAFRAMKDARQTFYNRVYNSGLIINTPPTKVKAGIENLLKQLGGGSDTAVEDYLSGIPNPATRATMQAQYDSASAADKGTLRRDWGIPSASKGLAPDLKAFIDQVQARIIDPAEKGAGYPLRELNIFKNFIAKTGSDSEKAMATQLQSLLHDDVYAGLQAMGDPGKKYLDLLDQASTLNKIIVNLENTKFASIFNDTKNAKTVAQAFLDGGIMKDSSQVKDFEQLIGATGIGQLRSVIINTTLTNAIDRFKGIGPTDLPDVFETARKTAVDDIEKLFSAVDGRINLKPAGSGFQAISNEQLQMLRDVQTFIKGFNMENLAQEFGVKTPGTLTSSTGEKMLAADVLSRASKVYETAKSPAELATAISKMTNIQDIEAVMSIVKKTPQDQQAIGAQILKNFIDSTGAAFKTGMTAEDYQKSVEGILNIGGENKAQAFQAIFEESTETTKLFQSLMETSKAFQAFQESKSSNAASALANSVLGTTFLVLGHPIMATGYLGKAARAVGVGPSKDLFTELTGKTKKELLASFEKDGMIQPTAVAKFWRSVGAALKSRITLMLAGHEAAKAFTGTEDSSGTSPDLSQFKLAPSDTTSDTNL
jgi:hypothetical protein